MNVWPNVSFSRRSQELAEEVRNSLQNFLLQQGIFIKFFKKNLQPVHYLFWRGLMLLTKYGFNIRHNTKKSGFFSRILRPLKIVKFETALMWLYHSLENQHSSSCGLYTAQLVPKIVKNYKKRNEVCRNTTYNINVQTWFLCLL